MEEDKIRQQARKLINEKYPYLPLKEWGYFEDMFINGWNEALIIQRVSQHRELLLDFVNVLNINELLEPNVERITIDDINEYLKI